MKPSSITIWEVKFTLVHASAEIKSFLTPDEVTDGGNFLFLPALSRFAFTLRDTVLVWDANDSKFLLKSGPITFPNSIRTPGFPCFNMGSFSSDGHFFACTTTSGGVCVWKEFPSGYALHQTFTTTAGFCRPLLSQNGESIIVFARQTIHLLPTRDPILQRLSSRWWWTPLHFGIFPGWGISGLSTEVGNYDHSSGPPVRSPAVDS